MVLGFVVLLLATASAPAADCPGNFGIAGCPYDAVQIIDGKAAPWALSAPSDVAVGPDGTVYIADSGRILVFDSNGNYLRSQQPDPVAYTLWSMAVGPDGRLYVIDDHSGLSVFEPDGRVVRARSFVPGTDPIATLVPNRPWSIAVGPDSSIWVAFGAHGRVEQIDLDGHTLRSVIDPAAEGSPPLAAREVAVAPDGNLIIGGYGGYDEMTPDGTFVRRVNVHDIVNDVAVGSDGHIFTLGSDWVTRVERDGAKPTTHLAGQLEYPQGIAVANGSLYVADTNLQTVVRLTAGGVKMSVGGTDPSTLGIPSDVWADGAAGIFVGSGASGRTVHFNPAGGFAGLFDLPGSAASNPYSGDRDASTGDVWIGNDSSLTRYAPDGTAQVRLTREPSLFGHENELGTIAAGRGIVYTSFLSDRSSPRLQAVDRDGHVMRDVTGPDKPIIKPSAWTVAPDGTLWVASNEQHRLDAYDTAGNLVRTISLKGVMGSDLAVDDAGRSYWTDHAEGVFVRDIDGTFVGAFGKPVPPAPTTSPGAFHDAARVSVEGGWLSVLDGGNNRIQRFHMDPAALKPIPLAPVGTTPRPRTPKAGLFSTIVLSNKRTIEVALNCAGTTGSCTGTVRVDRILGRKAHPRYRTLTTTKKYKLKAGTHTVVKLSLSRAGRRTVAHVSGIRARIVMRASKARNARSFAVSLTPRKKVVIWPGAA